MKVSKTEYEESKKMLLESLKPGDTIYTQVTHVSRSGMSRRIKLHTIKDNAPYFLTYHAARVLGWPSNDAGIRADGCGMDMCFHTVYTLGRHLFPNGFAVNGIGRNGDKSGWDNDGGYALTYRSI